MKTIILCVAIVLMSENVWAEEMQTSGICGATAEDCSWNYEDGKLTITGKGEMSDFKSPADQPWYQWKEDITQIEMSGITKIGVRSLGGFEKVTNITIPASVKILGTNAFASMHKLESVNFEEGSLLESLDFGVFAYDRLLKNLEIPESVKHLGGYDVFETSVSSLVLPKGLFEEGGYIGNLALKNDMTIYCPKEYQKKCEDYLETAQELTNNRDAQNDYIKIPIENITLQTYEKDGDAYFINGKWYQKPNDVLTGKRIKKLRYTVEEAMKATENGDRFHVFLTYK